jgi:hypothetical protein
MAKRLQSMLSEGVHQMRKNLALLMSGIVLSAGLIYAAVRTDYNHQASFSGYHTYSWIGVNASEPLWKQRIMNAVDSEMSAKGFQKVESGGDVAVSAVGQLTERDTMETFYSGFPGWGWRARWWGGGMGTTTTEVIPERVGNLTVDLFDGRTKQLVWRGVASDVLSSKPDKNEQKMEHSLADMFKHYPPKEKG